MRAVDRDGTREQSEEKEPSVTLAKVHPEGLL
jgi:hypothetical protein